MRLPPRPGEALDRSRPVSFRFGSQRVEAFAGDTFGSALQAAGRRVLSRSFKYHRPRGLTCCTGNCPNCLMTIDGVPNVRVCVEPVREGARVEGQNVLGSLDRDWLSVVDRVGGPFTPVGFYYRTMIRPRRAWPLYERALRRVAGLGRVPDGLPPRRYDTEHRRARVLVVGGGRAGREAALAAAAERPGVVLVDDRRAGLELDGVEVVAPARVLGIWEGGLVPVEAGTTLLRFRADHVVVAAGAVEQPLLFPGNDLVGVVLPEAVRRLVGEWSVRPGERAVVVAADEDGLDVVPLLRDAGVEVAEVVDLRERPVARLAAHGRRALLQALSVDGRRLECDLAVVSGGRQPAYSLLAQAGARVEYDERRGVFVPRDLPPGIEWAGDLAPAGVPAASYGSSGKDGRCVVCLCEDVTDKDVHRALREGFDSIELLKRYTTMSMGPCQGKLCQLPASRLHAALTGRDPAAVGTTTARPPWQPVELGLLAGRHHEPTRRTPLHDRHEALGATFAWAGPWRRPLHYGDPAGEVRAVHEALGAIDVSTLGKLLVEGPDAVTFLERLYPNRFADLSVGRVRYGVLSTDGGRIMDDGTIARLADDLFYVTTTSTGADAVVEWLEWWNAIWRLDLDVVDVTGALAAVNLAGPRARAALGSLTDADLSADAFAYLDARELDVAGVRCLALRIGFVGELGYELHCAATEAGRLWDALAAAGARPFGLEPQRVLRLEKQHVIVGQDTDSESNVLAAGMPWLAKLDKDDFVGRGALAHVAELGPRELLVGFRMRHDVVPLEGAQVVRDHRPVGRVTSARRSEAAGGVIGLAWVPPDLAEEGAELAVVVDGATWEAEVRLEPFHDPTGARMRA